MSKIKQLKQELKTLASNIKIEKALYKDYQRGIKTWSDYIAFKKSINSLYVELSKKYRHMHIAYCLLRGRTMEQIENKNRENNAPNMTKVEEIMREYRDIDPISCGDSVVGNE